MLVSHHHSGDGGGCKMPHIASTVQMLMRLSVSPEPLCDDQWAAPWLTLYWKVLSYVFSSIW